MTNALRIEGLWWRYPTYSDNANPWVLRDVSLNVEQGACFGITGPSGAGKTTVCRAMLGIIPHNARLTNDQLPHHFRGNIAVFGEAVTAQTPVTNHIGMVLQDPENQFLRMSLLHELALGLQIQGVPNAEILQRTHEALAMVGLEHLWHGAAYLHPADLSGGQKQRVAIAAFLAMRPRILVLDEPTSDLDPSGKREIIKTIARLRQQEQMTIILVEQDPEILATFCDTIALLNEGRVELIAPPSEFYAQRDLLECSGASIGELPRISWYSGHTFEGRPPLTIEEAAAAFGPALTIGRIDGQAAIGRGTDARKGPPTSATRPPSLPYTEDAPAKRAYFRRIVGTGVGWMRGGVPCGRPSGSPVANIAHVNDMGGRPFAPSHDVTAMAHCGRPSVIGDSGDVIAMAPCERPSALPVANIVTAENVWYHYADGTEALQGVDLTVYRGEMLALLGPNGSGKTTFAKILAGIYRASRGRVQVLGQDLASRKVRATLPRSVGYVFQNPDHQLFRRKVSDEIAYGLKNLGIDAAHRRTIVAETLEAVDLTRYADEDPLFLSKGQRQRLAVAAVLAMGPELLVVDEPTTGQDFRSVQAIMQLLLNLQQQGKTIVIITHDMSLVAEYCQRVLTFRDGRIVFTGTPRELFQDHDMLNKTGLHQPTSAALSTHLREQHPALPFLLTIQEWVAALSSHEQ